MIYTDNMAKLMAERAGDLYRPSNGSEGEYFQDAYCQQCKHDQFDGETASGSCDILLRSMAFDTSDEEYPREWIIASDGQPTCTAFELEKADA